MIINQVKKIISSKKLKILFVASEAAPFAKAGGLGDVMHSLPLALKKLGHDARIMIPRYGTIDPKKYNLKMELSGLKVPTDQPKDYPSLICNVKRYSGRKTIPAYFLENMEYYEKRANVYGYSDDQIRWVLLCRGTMEFLKKSSWVPDIIVASDWQTGLIPNYMKTNYREDPVISKISVIFAIHNLRYQGMCDFKFIKETERDSGREPIPDFFNPRLAKLNWMLRGIMYSDFIVTVSPTYAEEILTPKYGEGLDKILSEKQHKIYGILNGIDSQKYNPQKSPHIPITYNIGTIRKKRENKAHLQKRLGLPQNQDVFLIGMVSRFTDQKGFGILGEIIKPLFKNLSLQFVFLGEGEPRYKEMIQKAKEDFPEKVGYFFGFDVSLPHLIFAGADAILLPSKFEPCGIVQMQAMRFGCIPITRETGGLADTVKDFNPATDEGDGFVFKEYDPLSLLTTIIRAHTSFGFKASWQKLIKKTMRKNFSWEKSAKKYLEVFCQSLKENQK
jgi:starch synthase